MSPPPLTLQDLETLRTYDEAAQLLNVHKNTVAKLVRAGDLEIVRIGTGRGLPRIPERAILDYINRRRIRVDKTAS